MEENTMLICPNCKKQFGDGEMFCDECGTKLAEVQTQAPSQQPQQAYEQPQETYQQPEAAAYAAAPAAATAPSAGSVVNNVLGMIKSIPTKWLIGAAAAVVVVVIALIIIFGGKDANYAVYLKDDEIFYNDLSGDPFQTSTRLFDDDNSFYISNSKVKVTEDGDIIFFPDKMDSSSKFSLYYRYTNKPKKDPVKIASDITSYQISADGSAVVYEKYDDSAIYHYNVKKEESNKISADVEDYYVSEDADIVYFIVDKEDTSDLYYYKAGKDKEKIDSDIADIEFVNEDFDELYYTKENDDEDYNDTSLYLYKKGKDKEKILSNVYSIINVYEDGEIYYTKAENEEFKYSDFITDDMKEADAAMKPVDYPFSWDYDTEEEFEAAMEKYNEYQDKLGRDSIRAMLENQTFTKTVKTLFFYDGKEGEKIADDYGSYITCSDEATVLVYRTSVASEKIKLSELDNLYDIESSISAKGEVYVANDGKTMKLEQNDAKAIRLNKDADVLYYIDDLDDDEDYGTLYTVKIKSSKLGKKSAYDKDVYTSYLSVYEDENISYYKDADDNGDSATLYFNKKKVDSDVALGGAFYIKETKRLYYAFDMDEDDESATLKVFEKGKAKKISDDVGNIGFTSQGDLLYLYDCSSSGKGDLYIYEGGKPKKLDTDVSSIISTYGMYD